MWLLQEPSSSSSCSSRSCSSISVWKLFNLHSYEFPLRSLHVLAVQIRPRVVQALLQAPEVYIRSSNTGYRRNFVHKNFLHIWKFLKLWTVFYSSNKIPSGLKLRENEFHVIPHISQFKAGFSAGLFFRSWNSNSSACFNSLPKSYDQNQLKRQAYEQWSFGGYPWCTI